MWSISMKEKKRIKNFLKSDKKVHLLGLFSSWKTGFSAWKSIFFQIFYQYFQNRPSIYSKQFIWVEYIQDSMIFVIFRRISYRCFTKKSFKKVIFFNFDAKKTSFINLGKSQFMIINWKSYNEIHGYRLNKGKTKFWEKQL